MSADGTRLCELFQQAGITHGITFSIEACYGAIDLGNRYTLDEVAKHEMLSAMVVAHPNYFEASKRWVTEAGPNPDVVGVKIHPVMGGFDVLSAGVMRLMEQVIEPSGLTVLSHVGNESPNVPIARYLELASRFPSIRFIAAHLGLGVLGVGDAAVTAWRNNPLPNVWFDMGTLRAFTAGAVETLLEAVGPDRICFGTDAPLYVPAAFARLLEVLDISEEDREKIAYRNALAAVPALASRINVSAP
jgi:hypothetical protein